MSVPLPRIHIAIEPTGLHDWLRQLAKLGFFLHLSASGPCLRHRTEPGRRPPNVLLEFAKVNRLAAIAFLRAERIWRDEHDDARCVECQSIVADDLGQQPATCLSQCCPFRSEGER